MCVCVCSLIAQIFQKKERPDMLGQHFAILGLEFDTFSCFTYLAFLTAAHFFFWYGARIGFGFWRSILVVTVVIVFAPSGAAALSAIEFHHSLALLWHQNFGSTHLGGYLLSLPIVLAAIKLSKGDVLGTMDGVSLAWVLGYAIGRFACLLSGDGCYGVATSSVLGMTFPHGIIPTNVPVWPTPLFESLYSLIIFAAFARTRPWTTSQRPGRIFFLSSSLMFAGRFAVEFIRRNPHYYGLSLSQWICIPLFIIFVSLSILLTAKREREFLRLVQ